jgi:branched-chain amino acid aminotransferase
MAANPEQSATPAKDAHAVTDTPYRIAPGCAEALANFKLPAQLGFGLVTAPVMYSCEFDGKDWGARQLLNYGPLEIYPGARALQYAELVFEGMKAYRVGHPQPNLFRPHAHWQRLANSSTRLSIPVLPESLFMEGVEAMVRACAPFIPRTTRQALYLRPFVFGTEPGYLIRNSNTLRYVVIANPSEVYSAGAMSVAIERHDARAANGGTGVAKTGGNYAASLRASSAAAARGHHVVLWLDAPEHRYVQELSGMNLFAVIDGELHTPELDGTILPGITRDSLIAIAKRDRIALHERRIAIDELLAQIGSGRCSELFACGTAAIVSPIKQLVDADGKVYAPAQVDQQAALMREALLSIQERRAPDTFGWVHEVPVT